MLQARTEEQQDYIKSLVEKESCDGDVTVFVDSINYCVDSFFDVELSFDTMDKIVSYLKMCHRILWMKIKANLAKQELDYYYKDNTIFLNNRNTDWRNETFILSLAEFGYNTEELLNEYKQTGKITI